MPVTSPSSLAAAMASYIQQTTPSPPPPQAEVREASFAANLQDLSAPARAGDSITVTDALVDVAEKSGRLGPMLMTTWQTRYTNQDGVTVATQLNTLIYYQADNTKT